MRAHTGVTPTASARAAADRRVLTVWIPAAAIGEALGFAVPAAAGVLTAAWPTYALLAAMLTAGAVEGALLGAAQAWALRRLSVPVRTGRWVALTAFGAILAYTCGLAPSTWATGLLQAPGWPAVAVAALLGATLLASIGGAQWWELRRRLPRAGHWVWITALAWLCALAAFLLIAMPLWREGQALWLTLLIGVGAGAVMATVAAAVTGLGLARLLPIRRSRD